MNLADNPPARQNRLYRIDSTSAEMRLALEFPVAETPSARNPYAGMGLSYDCELHALWLSSVAGSSPGQERGKIFRIDLPTLKLSATLEDVDAFGLASFQSGAQQGLLFGSARSSDLWWQALSASGERIGAKQALLSIAALGPMGNERVRKIEAAADGTLLLYGTPFHFNLAQPAANQPATKYKFAWDQNTQSYRFVDWGK
ncbi:hypothetical protein HC761_01965 [bacterium]|nr:hypothetical protein [bacterium]